MSFLTSLLPQFNHSTIFSWLGFSHSYSELPTLIQWDCHFTKSKESFKTKMKICSFRALLLNELLPFYHWPTAHHRRCRIPKTPASHSLRSCFHCTWHKDIGKTFIYHWIPTAHAKHSTVPNYLAGPPDTLAQSPNLPCLLWAGNFL